MPDSRGKQKLTLWYDSQYRPQNFSTQSRIYQHVRFDWHNITDFWTFHKHCKKAIIS